jgi:hypothetical protein
MNQLLPTFILSEGIDGDGALPPTNLDTRYKHIRRVTGWLVLRLQPPTNLLRNLISISITTPVEMPAVIPRHPAMTVLTISMTPAGTLDEQLKSETSQPVNCVTILFTSGHSGHSILT